LLGKVGHPLQSKPVEAWIQGIGLVVFLKALKLEVLIKGNNSEEIYRTIICDLLNSEFTFIFQNT